MRIVDQGPEIEHRQHAAESNWAHLVEFVANRPQLGGKAGDHLVGWVLERIHLMMLPPELGDQREQVGVAARRFDEIDRLAETASGKLGPLLLDQLVHVLIVEPAADAGQQFERVAEIKLDRKDRSAFLSAL